MKMADLLRPIEMLHLRGTPGEGDALFYKDLVENLYDGVYFVDPNRRITFWNRGAERLSGYSSAEVVGKSCFDNLLSHVDGTGCPLCIMGCPLKWTMEDGEPREAEIYLRHKLGHRVPVSVRVAPIKDSRGLTVGAVEIFTDISEKKRIERRAGELEGLAYLDPLTGLANRRFTELKVRQALEDLKQFDRGVGLIMIDLDEFKQVNDRFGHQAGDFLLQAISRTLQSCMRPTDLVGRWGGEEFVVLATNMMASLVELQKIAERCRILIARNSVLFDNQRLSTTASIGATLLRADDTGESALVRADKLMYSGKTSGRNRISLG
jgi:diguanylate cyclase (GGDEF)-like protein/PAS domain S-box-containing protein